MAEIKDPYEDQLSAARYRAERDVARQELDRIREKADKAVRENANALRLLAEDGEAARWVREHGGLDSVKKLLDWVVGHCSTKQQLDFDFWLSGRVMHELGFDEDMADRYEVERRLLARLMPEGYEWPTVDGKPVDFVTGYEPSLGVLEAVSIYSNGACDVMGHDGIIKGVKEIHVSTPKVLDADGLPLLNGETVWSVYSGTRYTVEKITDGLIPIKCRSEMGSTVSLHPSQLTHTKPEPPDTYAKLYEDVHDERCGSEEFVRRCRALAERDR